MANNQDHQYVFIAFSKNWADEFDVTGVYCCPVERWNNIRARIKQILDAEKKPYVRYFGSNQYIEFDGYEDWLDSADIVPVSEAFYNEWITNIPRHTVEGRVRTFIDIGE